MKLIATIKLDLEAKNPNNAYMITSNKKTGRAMTFLKSDYKAYKKEWIEEAERVMDGKEPVAGALLVKSIWTFGTRRRKDLQNCGKLEYDALNGIVYNDDSQIVLQETAKVYSKNKPSIIIEVYSLDDYEDWEF